MSTSTISNGVVERYSSGQSTAGVIQVNSGAVANLHVSNVSVVDPNGSSFSAAPQLLDISAGSVTSLSLESPANANGKLMNLFSAGSAGRITSIVGADNFAAAPSASCGTVTGTNRAGKIAASSSVSSCTLTFGGQAAASAGWSCSAANWTTPANAPVQTGGTGTSATLTGTIATGNVLSYRCSAF